MLGLGLVTVGVGLKTEHHKYQEENIDLSNPSMVEHYGSGSRISELSQEARSFPSSSVEDLMMLYEKEIQLVVHIKKVKHLLQKLIISLRKKSKKTLPSYSAYYYSQDDLEDFHEEVEDYLPTKEEFVIGGGVGIVQIQSFYELSIGDVVDGKVKDFYSNHKLNTNDCLFLAKSAESIGRLDKKLDWMEAALDTAQEKAFKDKLTNILIQEKIAHDDHLLEHGFMKYTPSEFGGTITTTKLQPFNHFVKDNPKFKKHLDHLHSANITSNYMFKNNPRSMGEFADPPHFFMKINFHNRALIPSQCSGVNLRPPEKDQDVKCLYLNQNNPYLRFGPFLLEQFNSKPFVGKIYNFVSETEANWIMDKTRGKMKPTPLLVDGELKKFTFRRISKINFIPDNVGTPSKAITDRMSMATQWRLDRPFSQENYQVMNYGPGGSIHYHLDQTDEELQTEVEQYSNRQTGGSRIATAMVYLKSPVSGGRTVFPQLALSVAPTARSLLFWHNLTPSSKPDTRSLHMACPVVLGNKWILNKWVKWLAHWDTHPCSRNREEHQGAYTKWDR